jgi:chromosome segregation ATPase
VEKMEKEEKRGRVDEEAREEERARYRETIAGLEGKIREADEARITWEDEVTQLRAALGGLEELLEGSREEAMSLSETHGAYEGALRSAVESAQELDIALEKAQAVTSESAQKLIACQNDIIRMRGERAALEASIEALGGECRALKLELGDR